MSRKRAEAAGPILIRCRSVDFGPKGKKNQPTKQRAHERPNGYILENEPRLEAVGDKGHHPWRARVRRRPSH